MSARNRGVTSIPFEFFPTPPWCVRRLVEACPIFNATHARVLEPACGDGAIIEALQETEIVEEWDACDLVATGEDYLVRAHAEYDVGITNPPFTLMQAFADKMQLECVDTFLLGRLNFLGGKRRHEWWLNNPADVYRLADRPSFAHKLKCGRKGCKGQLIPWNAPPQHVVGCACEGPLLKPRHSRRAGQDATEYAWFHWGPSATGRIWFLDPTPKAERVDRIIPALAEA